MKTGAYYLLIIAAILQQPALTLGKPDPARTEARQLSELDELLTVRVSGDGPSAADAETATSAPVIFTVKNVSRFHTALMHVMTYYRDNVAIRLERESDKDSTLFPLPGSGGGYPKFIAPGETFEFKVDVPISLFQLKGEKLVAIVIYGGVKHGKEFLARSHSKPFTLPSNADSKPER